MDNSNFPAPGSWQYRQNAPYVGRAIRAYTRQGNPKEPSTRESTCEQWRGLRYVVLRNGKEVLAVYRILTTGKLKRLKRWAKQIEFGIQETYNLGYGYTIGHRNIWLNEARAKKMRRARAFLNGNQEAINAGWGIPEPEAAPPDYYEGGDFSTWL